MPQAEGRVAGLVLAAGSSSRLGTNKLLLDVGGEALVRRAVKAEVEAGLDPVVVVLGHEAERVRQELLDLPCQTVLNPEHALGVRGSLQKGLAHLPEDPVALVVALADMPFVTAAMIAKLVARYRESTPPLVVSRYGEVEAPPTLYDRALFPELLTMTGEGCGKQVVRRHMDEAVFVPWPESALADIDLPEDYERIRAHLVSG